MKVRYQFANEVVEIEVADEWGDVLVDLDRQEYNNDHRETRRHVSMDMLIDEQGVQFADPGEPVGGKPPALSMAVETLSSDERELLYALMIEGVSQKEYAHQKGVHPSSISRQLQAIRKKLCKLL